MLPMTAPNTVLFREIPMVQKIIRDETWLEGERRGRAVPPHDAVVNENVCRIILEIGGQLRNAAIRGIQRDRAEPARWIKRALKAFSVWHHSCTPDSIVTGPSHE